MSRVLLLTSGTRGDAQPFVALARGLQRAVGPIFARMLREAQAAAAGADLIVHHPKSLAAPSLAEAHGIAAVMVLPVPAMTPTRAFALPLLGDRDLGPSLNRASYAPLALQTSAFRGVVDAWRRELGLPRARLRAPHLDARGQPVPTLYPVSPRVVARPRDWPASTVLTGFWFLDDHEPEPPAELAAFLAAGSAPIAIGFGSMVGRDAAGRSRLVLEAVERAGVRAVLVTGWGGLDAAAVPPGLRDRVLAVPSVPFEWLFPRTAAVVHHGGAGTTAEGLRAGVPSLVCPFFGDQPFWGARVARLGVGPRPIPQRRLTTDRLAVALRTLVEDGAMRSRAAALGAELAGEDGVGEAVRRLEGWLAG